MLIDPLVVVKNKASEMTNRGWEARLVTDERIRSERRFHDQQAAARAADLRPQDLVFSDESYVAHASWIGPGLDALGDVRGLRVLDLGCGHGMASVVLARRGARMTSCDLSLGYVREARTRADANGVAMQLFVCNGERLPFADQTFPRIWGNAVLHHLDLLQTAREIRRVLTPGGRAVFCEPWGGNRWLNLARRRLPYPEKQHTPDEIPLSQGDLNCLRDLFPGMTVQGHQLFSMLGRVLTREPLVSASRWCDRIFLRRFPRWQRYCRYVVIILGKT
jgi:SAM-dependent methyltransferase